LAGRVTLATDVPPDVAANFFPEDVDERLTVMAVPLVVGFPKVSSSVVVKALVAEVLAVAVKALDVITSLAPIPGTMLKVLVVADVRPLLVAVSV